MNNNNYFIDSTLKKFLLPTILGILETTIVGFVNTLFAGQYIGKDALTAMNMLTSFTFLYAMLGCLINIGASTIAALALGKDDEKTVGEFEGYAFISSIVIPIIISIAIIIFLRPILFFLGADQELYDFMRTYSIITIIFGFLTTLMYFPFNFLRVDGRAKASVLIYGIMVVVDVVLLLILLGLGMGLVGVAIATTVGTAVADIVGVLILFRGRGRLMVPIYPDIRGVVRCTIGTFRMGAPSALNNLCNMLRTMIINSLLLHNLGKEIASEFAVACTIITFASAFVVGFGQTIVPMIGIFLGERDVISIKVTMKRVVNISALIMGIITLVLIILAEPLLSLFGIGDWSMVSEGKIAIYFVALTMIPSTIINIYIFYYSTIREINISLALTFCRAFLLVVIGVKVLIDLGLGTWYMSAFLLGDIFTFLIMLILASLKRKKCPKRKGLLLLENPQEEKNIVAFSVPGDHQGAVEASCKVEEFCQDKDLSPKVAMLLPLALEELLIICSDNCLENDENKFADVRIMIYNENSIILRIRCGGKLFDPIKWYKNREASLTAEEMAENMSLGIRMIEKQAKSINYRRILGVNNLIVEL